MSSFRSRARRLAFGDSTEQHNDTSSSRSSSHSRLSFGAIRHTSSISEPGNDSKITHVTPRRTNRVRHIHRNQPFELFVEALEADGCVVVQDFINPQISQRVLDTDDSLPSGEQETSRRSSTIDVNAMIRESLLTDSLYQTLTSHFLTLETISWQDKQIQMNLNKPRLSSSSTRNLHDDMIEHVPAFHRADSIHHHRHSAATHYDYRSRRDTSLGLFVPELDSLSCSIDISTIPGSHLWDDQKPDITKGVKELELRTGEALIVLGSLYHKVGSVDFDITTSKPSLSRSSSGSMYSAGTLKEKLVHEIWMCSGIYMPACEILHEEDED